MKYGLLIALATGAVQAAPLPPAPGLPPTAIVRPLLDQDPEVAAARAGREMLRQDAALAQDSPYEWTAKVTAQRRTVEAGPHYKEWNAGIERTLRLPVKASADRRISQALLDEGDARYGEALHETARELLGLWLDWAHAEQALVLAAEHQQAASDNLAAVNKRVKAGDAAALDAGLARGDLADQQRLGIEAKTAAAVAWARPHARFPGFPRVLATLPSSLPLAESPTFWRERILAQSDELKITEAQLLKAQAVSARMRAERTPEPTVGLYTASEVGGRERITGIMFSIPLPGAQRAGRDGRAAQAMAVSQHEVALKRRALDGLIAVAMASAQGAQEGWQVAEAGAADMRDNARLLQRAYTLGETDLPTLLTARRQATTAEQNALAARIAAARAYYGVLVDAHVVWDMEHE